jgi:hypothetical protein
MSNSSAVIAISITEPGESFGIMADEEAFHLKR